MSVRRRQLGTWTLVLFAVGGGALYLTGILVVTLLLEDLPTAGWIGFGVAATVVFAASTILAVFLVRASRAAGSEAPRRRAPRGDVPGVLVVADEGCSGAALAPLLAEALAGREAEVLVVAPELVSAVHYLDSDVDRARARAAARLEEILAALRAAGLSARGEIGSESPLEAIADALAVFPADEIVVATPPPERTNWLEQGVVERARELYETPVEHLVVDVARPAGARTR